MTSVAKVEAAWRSVAADVQGCRACPLWANATVAVFGEGPVPCDVMLVGEQPGDREDVVGRPFVGPAGKVLDRCLEQAGADRRDLYLTNAVKHFKWTAKGKRRIHQKPTVGEASACRQWLEAEIELVTPRLIIPMGSTAARTLLGPEVKVTRDRGRPIASPLAQHVVATVHPSSILRGHAEERRSAEASLADDLEAALDLLR